MDIQQMYPEDLEQYLSRHKETEYQLVDVRQPEEYGESHIPGAKLLPLSELEGRLDELDANRDLIFYCRSGTRSNIAALFARDSGLLNTGLSNLVGGISAWEGTILSEFPRFEVFQEGADFSQTLERAMNMEKGTALLYEAMIKQSGGLGIQATLTRLAGMEVAHARVIYRFLSKEQEIKPFDEFFASLSGDIVEGGWDLDAAVKRLQPGEGHLCLFLTELALELEYLAYDLYRSMAEAAGDLDQQKALFFLAEQEKAHVRLLNRGLPGCVDEP